MDFLALFPDTRLRYIHDVAKDVVQGTHTLDLTWSKKGYGTFFSVNGFPAEGRADESRLLSLNGNYVDFDTDPNMEQEEREQVIQDSIQRGLETGVPSPTIITRTRKGVHMIWLYPQKLEPTADSIARWRDVQNRLVRCFNGDPHCKDPARILRVPGTLHLKDPSNPFRVYVKSYKPECRVTLDELDRAVPRYSDSDISAEKLPISKVLAGLPVGKGLRHAGIAQVAGYYLRSAKTAEEVEMARIALYAWDRFQNKSPERWEIRKRELDNTFNNILKRELSGREQASAATEAVLVNFADIKSEPIQWLWQYRIALGKFTLFVGDPDVGKSLLTAAISSAVSNGNPWYVDNLPCPKGDVIILSAEDDASDTIKPRLEAAGADVRRIHILQAIRVANPDGSETERMFSLERDLDAIEAALKSLPECKLVVIDPISAYLGQTDSHRNAAVRGLLAPMARLAARYKIALVAIEHLNKNSGEKNALYRPGGSLAFVAAARAVFFIMRDPDNRSRRLFFPIKNNISPEREKPGLAYTVTTAENGSPVIVWEPDPIDIPSDFALTNDSADEKMATGFAVMMLERILSEGPKTAKQVYEEGEDVGLTEKQIRTAQKKLGVVPRKTSFRGEWLWELPKREGAQDAPQPEGALEQGGHLGGQVEILEQKNISL